MAINLEYCKLLSGLERAGALAGIRSVIELGAQAIAVDRDILAGFLRAAGKPVPTAHTAPALYASFGIDTYAAIDLSGADGSLAFDLNTDLRLTHGFVRTFDLISNLGTAEHCFDQQQVFRTMHDLCRPGGLMLHSLPSQGWANHGFFSYSPKFVADLARANGYEVLLLRFTTNQGHELRPYTLGSYRRHDGKDVLLYAALRRRSADAFRLPLDSHYFGDADPDYASYIKGHWYYTKGRNPSFIRNATIAVRDAVRGLKRRFGR